MNRWQTVLLSLLCAVAITLSVLFALERSERIVAEGKVVASAEQVDELSTQLKELRWALVVANARLAALGAPTVGFSSSPAVMSTPTTTPTTASQPNPRACLLAPLNPLC